MQMICQYCNSTFYEKPARVRDGKGKYCSKQCYGDARGRPIEKQCLVCSTTFKAFRKDIRKGLGKYCGYICYWATLKGKVGALSPSWQGGLTPINSRIRGSRNYIEWRKQVFKRDDYICIWCSKRGGEIHADHIVPFSTIIYGIKKAVGIEKLYSKAISNKGLWNIKNGRTLCVECHSTTPTYRRKWSHATYNQELTKNT